MLDEKSRPPEALELGRRLREGRAGQGWSLRQAAEQTGVSNGYLSLMEQGGVRSPSPRYLRALAEHYQLAFDELMALAGHAGSTSGTVAVSRSGRVRRDPEADSAEAVGREPLVTERSAASTTDQLGTRRSLADASRVREGASAWSLEMLARPDGAEAERAKGGAAVGARRNVQAEAGSGVARFGRTRPARRPPPARPRVPPSAARRASLR